MPLSEVAQFSVTQMQILGEKGEVDVALDPGLEPDQLLSIYRAMLLARTADERMLKLQRQGRLGTFPPCIGHEAVSVGAAAAMAPRDWMVTAYRELGGRLLRGETLDLTLAYYNGFEEGSNYPAERRILPTQVILGSQIPHAVGLAYAMRYQGEEQTAVVCFNGDGATSQGDFHEGLNIAGVWQVPVVFICQNNGWAISIPREAQTRSQTLCQKAIAYGFPGIQVDGNDILAVYRATREALDRARAGEGPTLIEAVTYRLMMHTTADDSRKYRSEAEEKAWWARDPLPRFRRYLTDKGLWDEEKEQLLLAELKTEMDQAVKRAEQISVGQNGVAPDAPFNHVFATQHEELTSQRETFLAELEREGYEHG